MTKGNRKNELFNAYVGLWKIMNNKERVIFCFLAVLMLLRCFAVIMTTQILACLVDVISGQGASIFGIGLPNSWTVIQVVIFCHIILTLIWMLCVLLTSTIRKFAVKVACKVNVDVLNIITKPRKNLDYKMTNGEAVFIANSAGESVIYLIKDLLLKILLPVLSCIVALVFIAQIDILCFVVFLICFIFILLSSIIRLKFESKYQNRTEKAKSKINNVYLNNIDNIALVTMLNSQSYESSILEKHNKDYKKQWYDATDLQVKYWFFAYFIQYFLTALGIIVCILRKGLEIENLANIIALVSYSTQLCSPLESVGIELGQLQLRAIQFNRLSLLKAEQTDFIDCEISSTKRYTNIPNDVKINKIQIRNLKISIGNFKKEYKNVLLQSNKINVICGDSGVGKSVFISSLLGLKTYQSGDIIINDEYKIKSLYENRSRVSLITQNAMMFDRSVIENLGYPNNDLTKEIKKYVKVFNLNKILNRSYRNENISKTLSGGEQKRISLIRGMAKEAEVYIFDEPTNDLDNENVNKVIQEIINLKEDSMVIVISHDKRIMQVADSIIELS